MSHAIDILTQNCTENKSLIQTEVIMDKTEAMFDKAKKALLEKEAKQKAKEEAEFLGTAMQQLLPEIFENKRAIPNCFLRGALFGMVRKGKRALVGNMPIFTMSQYSLIFTGYELDQNDLELWDTLMYLAKNRQIDNELRLTMYDLLKQMGIQDNGTNRKALAERIKRLKTAVITLKREKQEYFGNLIDDGFIDERGDGNVVIRYNKKLAPLFIDGDYTLISIDIRHLLGDNQLARWLYNFYETHHKPLPFSIDFIQKLCRSNSTNKEFKRLIKTSLELVKKSHLAVNYKSKWDYEITNNNYVIIHPNGKTKNKKQLELF